MDFLGMGPFEILLVLIIGFLFLGPEKLPAMAAKAGELYRKFTRATANLTKSITEEVSAEVKATSDLTKSITSVAKEISAEAKAASDLTSSIVEETSTKTKPGEIEKTTLTPMPDDKKE